MRYNIIIMKRPRIYLDTSIFKLAVDAMNPEKKELTLNLFNGIMAGKYEAFISNIVMLEVNEAPEEIANKLKAVIKNLDPEELIAEQEVYELANKYIEQGVIPVKYDDDALHIAVASVNELDVIVSWNFEHIVKFKTKREVVGINTLMGYKPIEIYSPQEVD
ncbi:MAG: type II toxin-antitoxin system VapC family toxin [Candidatus Omnitrophota bacterium]